MTLIGNSLVGNDADRQIIGGESHSSANHWLGITLLGKSLVGNNTHLQIIGWE
jgi:hypothetical protein